MSEELFNKLDEQLGKINDFTKSSEAQSKANAEGVESLKAEVAEQKKMIADVASSAKALGQASKKEKSAMYEAGECFAKALFGSTEIEGKAVPNLSTSISASGGVLDRPEFLGIFDAMRTEYGVVRANAEIITLNSHSATWVEVVEDDFPSIQDENLPIGEGCCDPCGTSLDQEHLTQHDMNLTKFLRYVCLPSELVNNNTNYDILGAFVVPRFARMFAKLEDWNGMRQLFNNANLTDYILGDSATSGSVDFSDLAIDDLLRLPFQGGKNNGQDAKLYVNADNISQLVLEKGTDDHHLLPALEWLMGNNVRGSLRSMFELSHILPATGDSAVSTPFAFYGTLRDHLALVERQGLEVAVSDQAGFICDTITVRAKAKIGFKLNGADASSQGVLVSTSAS